ncbi:MAG TPA: lasso peptide biosynthesis B2 protein [Methylomirabilota bacterium]|jgi:hypothetical protein
MATLGKLLRLSPAERRLVVQAAWLILILRVALTALPYRRVERLVSRLARRRAAVLAPTDRIAWAVAAVGRRLPGATCLVQALAASIMLARGGTRAIVRIGVARERGGPLESHAWVESEGRVVIGDVHLDRYVPIATWGSS